MSLGSAIVVGVGPATGGAIARRFAKGGYAVALVARRLESSEPVKKEIIAQGGRSEAFAADTTVESEVNQTFKRIEASLGPVDVVVYNAGPSVGNIWPPPSVEDVTAEQFEHGLKAGALGAFLWAKQAIPGFKQRQKGTILLTGATAGLRGAPRFSLLSPGKFALRSLGQTLAKELGPEGIHVAHIIIDGIIESERTKQMTGETKSDKYLHPEAIAEEYWKLHTQHKSTWSQEIDLRPFAEKF